jgi:hypothetical protein
LDAAKGKKPAARSDETTGIGMMRGEHVAGDGKDGDESAIAPNNRIEA